MWTTSLCKSLFKNILSNMNFLLSKIRSVHTYVMPWTVYFGWICIYFKAIQCSAMKWTRFLFLGANVLQIIVWFSWFWERDVSFQWFCLLTRMVSQNKRDLLLNNALFDLHKSILVMVKRLFRGCSRLPGYLMRETSKVHRLLTPLMNELQFGSYQWIKSTL